MKPSNTEIIVLLLNNDNTDPNTLNKNGYTPLHYAAIKDNIPIIELLLENKKTDPDIPNKDGDTPLHFAAIKDNIKNIQILLKYKADPYIKNKINYSPIDEAIRYKDIQILTLLLQNKTGLNRMDNNGITPLHYAIYLQDKNIVQLLLKSGANPNMKDRKGYSLLHKFVFADDLEYVNLLLENGADPNIIDDKYKTPSYYANYVENIQIEKSLEIKRIEAVSTPGGRFLNEYKNSNSLEYKEKYTPKSNIFMIMGHGCDTGEQFSVPPNCIYYTRAVCGLPILVDDVDKSFKTKFITYNMHFDTTGKILDEEFNLHAHTYSNDRTNKTKYKMDHMYSNPRYELLSIYESDIDSILKYIQVMMDKLIPSAIVHEYRLYLFINMTKLHYFSNKRYLSYSGIVDYKMIDDKMVDDNFESTKTLYSLLFDDNDENFNTFWNNNVKLNDELYNKVISNPNFKNEFIKIISDEITKLYKSRIESENFFIDLINYSYKYSFFPNIDDVKKLYYDNKKNITTIYDFKKLIRNNFDISQIELFQHFEGIYYNTICRDPCMDEKIGIINRRRRNSIALKRGIKFEYPKDVLSANMKEYNTKLTTFIENKKINKKASEILQSNNTDKLDELNRINYTIFNAITNNKPHIVEFLLKNKINPNVRDTKENTPLHIAIGNKNIQIIELLLENKANPNMQNDNGNTPLHIAIYLQDKVIIKLLLENGAKPDMKNKEKNTPLYFAISKNDIDTVKLLLKYGAEDNIKTIYPLFYEKHKAELEKT